MRYVSFREVKEELNNSAVKENEAIQKRKEIEKKYEGLENETVTLRQDLKMALKRITDLQVAIQGELDDSNSDHSDRYVRLPFSSATYLISFAIFFLLSLTVRKKITVRTSR